MILQHTSTATVAPRARNIPVQSSTVTAPIRTQEADPAPETMSLQSLAARCVTESDRFYKGKTHDTRYSYELFRRALVERNDVAWEMLYAHYSPLVESWVRRTNAFMSSGESSEYFVVGAFTKFWRAVTPDRFATFPNLATLLQYLQLCASSVVIDSVRSHSWGDMVPEEAATNDYIPQSSPDDEALERVAREEFWNIIDGLLNDESERAVVYGSFVLGMTPRAIAAKYTTVFASVNDVYNIKRNVLSRLGRNAQIRQMLAM